MSRCCGNCGYRKPSKLKIQFNEIPITAYCGNEDSQHYDKYVWDDDICEDWEGDRLHVLNAENEYTKKQT